MIEFNQKENQLKITIPLSGIQELCNYQKGILGILRKIKIENCSPKLQENLKSVYKLLDHLVLDKEFLSQNENLVHDYKDLIKKGTE